MRNTGINKLQYLLYALLVFALTGCGASTLGNLASNNGTPGAASLKMVYVQSKGAARQLASAPAAVTSVQVTVTGTGTNGSAIPVVNGSISTGTNQGTITGIYAGLVTLSVQAVDINNNVLYEGFAIAVPITAGATTTLANPIVMSPPLVKAQDVSCIQCHQTNLDSSGQNLVADFKQSQHYTNSSWNQFLLYTSHATYGTAAVTGVGCAACHGPKHDDLDPSASGRCFTCHGPTLDSNHTTTFLANGNNVCSKCHQSHNATGDCLSCHSVGQNANATGTNVNTYVNDNNGVRAAVLEFSKNSHHVVGKTLTAADCAVCHLEGTAAGVVNPTYHMANATIHLRNCNTSLDFTASSSNTNQSTSALGTAEYVWDPANPNHTAMDQFCMSCHNAQGATAAVGIVAGNSASNPFNDAISNGYDQMSRQAVVAVFDQMNPTNAAHHAVRAPKYNARTRATATGASKAAFNAFSSAASPGIRHTLYDAGVFVSTYTPLGATLSVADNSQLHCGDCHTVGQWKPGSTTANGVITTVAIGAHGSANEYLLRNAIGSDALHHQDGANGSTAASSGTWSAPTASTPPFLVPPTGTVVGVQANGGNYVCFLCHTITFYGATGGHNGIFAQATQGCNNSLNESVGRTGAGTATSRVPRIGTYTVNGVNLGGTANVFGMTCTNCHAAGNQGFGGIHGSNTAFSAYSGVNGPVSNFGLTSRVPYRFMGGMSLRYNGGNQPTTGTWEQKTFNNTSHDGCYNLTTVGDNSNAGAFVAGNTTSYTNGATMIKLWGPDAWANANTAGNGGSSALQNNGTVAGSWGACGHHTGSTTVGSGAVSPSTEATAVGGVVGRAVQRPLSY